MVKKIENIRPSPYNPVRLKKAGPVSEVRYIQNQHDPPITKLNRDEYVLNATGEILPFKHTEHRTDNTTSIAASMQRLRDLLSTNVTDPRKALWCTLTYKINQQDAKQAYEDFRRFNQRLRNYVQKEHGTTYEYISAWEYQSRGALHCHMVLIFPKRRPYLPGEALEDLWGLGYVSVKALRNTDNVANYLCQYLTDLPLEEALPRGFQISGDNVKEVETQDAQGRKSTKYFAKAERLHLYPRGFRLYRRSKGIRDPEIIDCTEAEAMREIGDTPLIYEKTIAVYPDGKDTPANVINFRKFRKD